jgi:glycosyltransferase involved in cell wall biosynthesis
VSEAMPTIERRFLLATPIPHYLHEDGSIWLHRIWHHDLIEHLTYLRDFTLASPRLPWSADADLVRVDPPAGARFAVVPIPALDSFGEAIRNLPRLTAVLWKAIGRADIVQSGVAGWPIAMGWIANPITLIRHKKLLIIVESAFWRIGEGQRPSWKARIRASVTEFLARWFVNRAHILFFTQPSYRASLLTAGRGKAYIIPATWINDEDILSDRGAELAWERRTSGPAREVRVIYAGRLLTEKGVDVLLAAVRRLDEAGVPVRVDVIGEGARREACIATAQRLETAEMSVLAPVSYGSELFELLGRYDAVVVPSIGDEQPRVVFDAYSQALPVLASNTDGLVAHVIDGETGRLFEAGDPASLAQTLRDASDTAALRRMGMNALAAARGLTHREMHRMHWRSILDALGNA